jgi:predicted house-cleaning noncanonical NTP pyrophosphatase (MazG superfamily)
MILEKQLSHINNKMPKINKRQPPKSINPDLTSLYFTSLFIGAKNSGKTYGLVKLIKNYESSPIQDADGNTLQIRTILFCPTGNSEANPVYKSLKSLDDDDIILQYSDEQLNDKIMEIQQDKEDIVDYKAYLIAWKRFMRVQEVERLSNEDIITLTKYHFMEPEAIPKPKYKYPPVIFLILDDLIGSNDCFKKGNSLISNLTIKHRHLGINIIYTTQNPKSIPNIIRNNIDIFVLYKFANTKMVLEKIYEECSAFLTEEQFEELYMHAVKEPHNALVIDTHPATINENRIKKNFDIVLSLNGNEPASNY